MKKGLLFTLMFTMLVALIGCGKSDETKETNQIETGAEDQQTEKEAVEEKKEEAPAEEEIVCGRYVGLYFNLFLGLEKWYYSNSNYFSGCSC